MVKKTNKKLPYQRNKTLTIGCLSIITWMIFVFLLSRSQLTPMLAGHFGVENTNWIVYSILLIPIALLTFSLAYKMDFSNYFISDKTLKISNLTKIILSLSITFTTLAVVWYLFITSSIITRQF